MDDNHFLLKLYWFNWPKKSRAGFKCKSVLNHILNRQDNLRGAQFDMSFRLTISQLIV